MIGGETVIRSALLRRIVLVGVTGLGAYGCASVAVPQHAAAAGPVQVTTQPALYPAWSSDIHNYVTRCANAPVEVSVNAHGSSVSVDGQPPRSDSFSTSVALWEGQEFLISTQSGSITATYHIRCLPSDFPSWTAQRSGTTQAAFLVLTPNLTYPPAQHPAYATVFDTNGVPRWWFKDSAGPPFDAKKLANSDDLVWTHFGGGPYERRQLDGKQTATYNGASVTGSEGVDEHDFRLLPNGNYLLAIDRPVSPYDLSSCGGSPTGTLDDEVLQEVSSAGALVRSFDVKDHIPLGEVADQWKGPCSVGDVYHFNSVEPVGDLTGDVIVSFRHLDAVYRLNMSSGNIIWKLGGTSTANSLTVSGDPDAGTVFGGQHDARLLPDGTLTIFDNRTDLSTPPRAVRYRLDTTSHTATVVEQVTDPAIIASPFTGSARKLAGGDWVVAWGGTPKVDELTPSGASIVFSLTFDNAIFSYRADPVTSTSYGDALAAGMDAQYPRSPGGPGAVVPEAPLTVMLGLGGTTAVGATLIRRRQRGQFPQLISPPG